MRAWASIKPPTWPLWTEKARTPTTEHSQPRLRAGAVVCSFPTKLVAVCIPYLMQKQSGAKLQAWLQVATLKRPKRLTRRHPGQPQPSSCISKSGRTIAINSAPCRLGQRMNFLIGREGELGAFDLWHGQKPLS